MQQPQQLPLINQTDNRDGTTNFDARLINGYGEQDGVTGQYQIYKRLGVKYTYNLGSLGTHLGQGLYSYAYWNSAVSVFGVAGQSLYCNGSLVGSVATGTSTTNRFRFSVIPITSPIVILCNGGNDVYTVSADGVTLTSVTPAFSNTLVPGVATLDGTSYIMDITGAIWGSPLNTPTWADSLNVILANADGSPGIALDRQLSYVIAFKRNITQVFLDNGNPTGSPLAPVPEAITPYGCADAGSIQSLDDILYWLTYNQSRSPQIAMMQNLKTQIISTPPVERLLQAALTGSYGSIHSSALKVAGHKFYILTVTGANLTLVYDSGQQLWSQWTDGAGNYWPWMESTFDVNGKILVQGDADGSINFIDAAYVYPFDTNYAGITSTPQVDIYTPNYSANINRVKVLNRMWFQADQTAGSVLYVRYSDNDYKTWSNFRQVDLSVSRPVLKDEGSFYKRAYHFRHLAKTSLRIRAVDLEYDIGTS